MAAIEVDKMIGNRLRQLRMQLGMSQEALGKEVGLTFQQIQKYEKGTNRVSVSRMLQFCDILQTTPNEIIGWKQPQTKAINNFSSPVYEAAREFAGFSEDMQIVVRRLCSVIADAAKKKR